VSDDIKALAEAALKGCAASVGPLIGLDLELREVVLEPEGLLPEGALAVLPLSAEVDGKRLCELVLASPLEQIATLARRLLDDDDPDKARDLDAGQLDAIAEVLNLMSGAVDQAVRAALKDTVRTRPLSWWRTTQPGEHELPSAQCAVAHAEIQIPSAGIVGVWLRVPAELFARTRSGPTKKKLGRVLLLGLDGELRQTLERVLGSAQIAVDARDTEGLEIATLQDSTEAIVVSGDSEGALELCRKLRLHNATWELPAIVCFEEPTHESVLHALESGASHVLGVPAEEIDVLRVLRLAQIGEE
jgi:hypothetical protein